jgi:hypothetical protein
VAENHFAGTHLPHQDRTETLLGKVVEILDKRGELENCGWIFCGQLNKEIHLILARRMEAKTTAYWIQQVYIWQDVSNAREGCWSDDDGWQFGRLSKSAVWLSNPENGSTRLVCGCFVWNKSLDGSQ